jgi:hypothetical protein
MDYDLWVRLAASGATIRVIGAPITIFRAHPEQKTSGPDKYLPELRRHAAALRERYSPSAPLSRAPAGGRSRIAFVNDVPEGGASFAHDRLGRLMASAGFETRAFHALKRWVAGRPRSSSTSWSPS